jgi:hypothetical protein
VAPVVPVEALLVLLVAPVVMAELVAPGALVMALG